VAVCLSSGCRCVWCVGGAVLVVLWSLWPHKALPSCRTSFGDAGWCMLTLYCTISGFIPGALGLCDAHRVGGYDHNPPHWLCMQVHIVACTCSLFHCLQRRLCVFGGCRCSRHAFVSAFVESTPQCRWWRIAAVDTAAWNAVTGLSFRLA
jgi:hypothetical protein